MRLHHLFPVVLLACTPDQQAAEVPAAFQEPTLVGEIKQVGSRGGYGGDLVEELFAEALLKDSALAGLVRDLDRRAEQFGDSLAVFHAFEANNSRYRGSAARHLTEVSDTLLRAPMMLELQRHQTDFDGRIAAQRKGLETYGRIEKRMGDLLVLLKLKRSLAMVHTYQREHWPDPGVIQREVERIKALERRMEAELGLGN